IVKLEGPLRHRQGGAEGGQQQLGGDGEGGALRYLLVAQLVVLADGAEVLARAGEPLGHPPEALPLHHPLASHRVAPTFGDALILGEQRLHGLELQVLGEDREGDGVADAGEEVRLAAIGLGDLGRQARVAAQPAGEEAQALAALRNRLDEDAAILSQRGDDAILQRDADRAGFDRGGRGGAGNGESQQVDRGEKGVAPLSDIAAHRSQWSPATRASRNVGATLQPTWRSKALATRKTVASSKGRPMIWSDNGRPSSSEPEGTATVGSPTRLAGVVKMSERYMASGSSTFSPRRKAAVGVVG